MCVHLPFISWFSAFLTRICPYMDEGAPPAVRVAGYWQFVNDKYDSHGYEQDMLMWVFWKRYALVSMFEENTNRYQRIWRVQKTFPGISVNTMFKYVNISLISCLNLWISCQYPVNTFNYPLPGGTVFLCSLDLNMVFTRYLRLRSQNICEDYTIR